MMAAQPRMDPTGRMLFVGATASTTPLAVGLLSWIIVGPTALSGRVLAVGLIALMATPILAVATSLVDFARGRDWPFVGVTLTVLAILMVTVGVAVGQP